MELILLMLFSSLQLTSLTNHHVFVVNSTIKLLNFVPIIDLKLP